MSFYFVITYNEWQFVKKCQNLTFNVNFLCQEIESSESFWWFFFNYKYQLFRRVLFGMQSLLITSIFETLISCPILISSTFSVLNYKIVKIQWFPEYVDFWPKSQLILTHWRNSINKLTYCQEGRQELSMILENSVSNN